MSFNRDDYSRLIARARELHRIGYKGNRISWPEDSGRVCAIAREIFKMVENTLGQQYPMEDSEKMP